MADFPIDETDINALVEQLATELSAIQKAEEAKKLAKITDEVLITGETGTGKELIARAMQGDLEGGFYRINCAGLPENLIESELFGLDTNSHDWANFLEGNFKPPSGSAEPTTLAPTIKGGSTDPIFITR